MTDSSDSHSDTGDTGDELEDYVPVSKCIHVPVVIKFAEPANFAALNNYGYYFEGKDENIIQLESINDLSRLIGCFEKIRSAGDYKGYGRYLVFNTEVVYRPCYGRNSPPKLYLTVEE